MPRHTVLAVGGLCFLVALAAGLLVVRRYAADGSNAHPSASANAIGSPFEPAVQAVGGDVPTRVEVKREAAREDQDRLPGAVPITADPLAAIGENFLAGLPDIQLLHEMLGYLAGRAVAGSPKIKVDKAGGTLTFEGTPLRGFYMCKRDGTHAVRVLAGDGLVFPPPFSGRELRFTFVAPGGEQAVRAVDCELSFNVRAPQNRDSWEQDWNDLELTLRREPRRCGYIIDYSPGEVSLREQQTFLAGPAGGQRCVTLRSAPESIAVTFPMIDVSAYARWLPVFREIDAQLNEAK